MEKQQVKKKSMGNRTRAIVFIALFVALLCVTAWITVPSAIPFTLQLFGVFLTLGLLGGKKGTISVACYLLLGVVGAPVFSGFRGGIGVLSGVTGGYIVGFLFTALVYWGVTALFRKKLFSEILGMVLGLLVCYAFGTVWFLFVKGNAGTPVDVGAALMTCVVPFLPFDAIKILLALIMTRLLRPHLPLPEEKTPKKDENR